MSRPAVFLDRDGVLVEEIYYPHTGEWEAPLGPEDMRLLPGAAAAAKRLADAGFALVVISNQAAYAKGKTTLRALWLAHERFVALLKDAGVRLDGCYYAHGHPDGVVPHFSGPSLDRKPGPYNIFIAAAQHDLSLENSWMVGDRATDVACARAAGVRPILVRNRHAEQPAIKDCPVADGLAAAVAMVLGEAGSTSPRLREGGAR